MIQTVVLVFADLQISLEVQKDLLTAYEVTGPNSKTSCVCHLMLDSRSSPSLDMLTKLTT